MVDKSTPISGNDIVGSLPSGPPVQIGGVDGTGVVRQVGVDQTNTASVRDVFLLEILQQIFWELRALRLATVANTCDGKRYNEQDFDPAKLQAEVGN